MGTFRNGVILGHRHRCRRDSLDQGSSSEREGGGSTVIDKKRLIVGVGLRI